MWSSEVERKGVIKCSPLAYGLISFSSISYILGFIVTFILIFTSIYGFMSDKKTISFWIIFTIFSTFLLTSYMVSKIGWALLRKRGFFYDYRSNKCTWNGYTDGE